jgi:hypothetical protein
MTIIDRIMEEILSYYPPHPSFDRVEGQIWLGINEMIQLSKELKEYPLLNNGMRVRNTFMGYPVLKRGEKSYFKVDQWPVREDK